MTMFFVSSLSRARIEQAGMRAERERVERIKAEAAKAVRAEPESKTPEVEPEGAPLFAIPSAEQQAIFDQIAAVRHPSRDIIKGIAEAHGFPLHFVKSSRRNGPLVRCRHECCYRLYAETALSLPEIGRRLGGRDHTTVLHGIRRHAKLNGLPLPRGLTWGRTR